MTAEPEPGATSLKKEKAMSNLDVIKALYESIANKDWHRFKDLTDPELEWIQNKGFPKGRHSHGVEEVVKNVFDVFARVCFEQREWRRTK